MLIYFFLPILLVEGKPRGPTTIPDSAPQVQTTGGLVEGITLVTSQGKKVDAFLGVPYGEAPIGKGRFQPSRLVKPWTNILETKENPPACYQQVVPLLNQFPILKRFFDIERRSEDCLKVNIWKPHKSYKPLPVMVWLFGGGFAVGAVSQELYRGDILASEGDLIVVSINYRVGLFGFLYLGDSGAPGNAGLHDQVLGLKWVQENIAAFGGDPNSVTLFGQSAGSAGVSMHMVSPMSRGLFHRAILESGVLNSEWAFLSNEKAKEESMKLVVNMGCPQDNISSILDCLFKADPSDLVSNEPLRGYFDFLIYKPTVDGKFLIETPSETIKKNHIRPMNVIIGQTKNEGSVFLTALSPFIFRFQENLTIYRDALPEIINEIVPWSNKLVQKAVLTEYNDWSDNDDPLNTPLISEKIFADYYFTCPINQFVSSLHSSGSKVYKYLYSHRLNNNPAPKWYGVVHAEDVPALFGLPMYDDSPVPADLDVSHSLIRLWSNFAKFGDPNGIPEKSRDNPYPIWPLYQSPENNQLDIRANSTGVVIGRRERFCAFWDKLVPMLMEVNDNS